LADPPSAFKTQPVVATVKEQPAEIQKAALD